MPVTSPNAHHLVLELRYEPTLLFYTKVDLIGLEFSDTLPDWERSPLALEIRNKKTHRRCFLSHQRSFYEALGFETIGPELDRAKQIFDRLHHDLKFSKVKRIGVRQWIGVTSDQPFPKLVKAVTDKLQISSDQFDTLLRGNIEDFGYAANVLTPEGWKYRLYVGPMERKQWFEIIPHEPGAFESREDFEKHKDTIPEKMILLDIDSFKEDVPYIDIATLTTSMRSVTHEIVTDLIKYLKG